MERRLAILQKHSKDRNETDPQTPSTPVLSTSLLRSSRLSSRFDADLQQQSHSRSSSVSRSGRHSRPPSRSSTPNLEDQISSPTIGSNSAKKAARKRLRKELQEERDVKKARRKSVQPTEVRTSLEYSGLNLSLPTSGADSPAAVCNHTDAGCDGNGTPKAVENESCSGLIMGQRIIQFQFIIGDGMYTGSLSLSLDY